MSAATNPNETAGAIEEAARDTASCLLIGAINETIGFVPPHLDRLPGAAITVAAHALIAKLDAIETSLLAAHRETMDALEKLNRR